MDIQTELRQLELMDPRHDNIYARILDGWQRAIDDAVEEAEEKTREEWYASESNLETEIEALKNENESLNDELFDKNAEIDRLVALVDSLESTIEERMAL